MFEHSLSGKCQYGDRCTKKLCTFQHKTHIDSEDEKEKDVEEIENVSKMFRDDDIKTDDQSNNDDEEYFQLYVKTNFPEVFKKFTTEKSIQCYYCDFLPRSKKLRDIEDEMMTHVEDTHKVAREDLDTENVDDEYNKDFLGLFTDE